MAELVGVIVAVCAVLKPETEAGDILPLLSIVQLQSKLTMLSMGVRVAVTAVP
jgi:hypothetical protein